MPIISYDHVLFIMIQSFFTLPPLVNIERASLFKRTCVTLWRLDKHPLV